MNKNAKETIIGIAGALLLTGLVITGDQLTRQAEAKASDEPTQVEVSTGCGVNCPCAGIVEVIYVTTPATITTPEAITPATPEAITKPAIEKPKKPKKKKYTKEDFEVLSKVIQAEVGNQSRECKYYVGAVVLNRVKSSIYPNTIKKVVFQKGQYACTWDGNYKRAKPDKVTKAVAKDLLENGVKGVPKTVTGQSSQRQGKVWKAIKCTNGVTCYFCHNKWVVKEYEGKRKESK